MLENDVKKYWLERYKEDKVGTIAKLSQAMQHMAWLREWQRIHGDEPRIKAITKKINGEKVKIGEADIAVPWSELDEFFKSGNEYGDIETVKFLLDKIESGDTKELTEQELHDLSEKENVKWSDGKHSLNPLQGYLYDFTDSNSYTLNPAEGEDAYGRFYPIKDYVVLGRPNDTLPEADSDRDKRFNETRKAFARFYTTRLIQTLLEGRDDSKYYDFVKFDITSVTTPEQIEQLDKRLSEILRSPEIKEYLELADGDAEMEKTFYERLREEVQVEIKKDSNRIENAHKVFVALETGKIDELLENQETAKWAEEIADREESKAIREELLSGENKEIGASFISYANRFEGETTHKETFQKVMTKSMYLIGKKFGAGFRPYAEHGQQMDAAWEEEKVEFKKQEECDKKVKDLLEKRKEKIDKFKKRVKEDTTGKYDRPGFINIDMHKTWDGSLSGIPEDRVLTTKQIPFTMRELAEAELLPEDYRWQEKDHEKITPKDICEADKEQSLTKTEVSGIKGLIDKIKSLFKGNNDRGEK